MKPKYSQESQDWSENLDDPDTSLVNFLQEHKPTAPAPAANFEQQLFAEIAKYPLKSPKTSNLGRWLPWTLLIPAAIATAIGFNWSNNRQYQVANMSEAEQVEIENSLINSWNMANDSLDDPTIITASNSIENEILSELAPLEYE